MKTRNGFVTNSSSSSFIVNKKHLTKLQVKAIKSHIHYSKRLGWYPDEKDSWEITDHGCVLEGRTWMDNFDMREFMEEFDVDMDKVKFDYRD